MTTETTGVTWPEFQTLSREYRYIPLWVSFNADLETPVTLFRKLTGEGCGYLLESVEQGRVLGRYSFAGADPLAYFTGSLPDEAAVPNRPLAALQRWLAGFRTAPVARRAGLPPFYGGAVGYFAYDLVRAYEKLPRQAIDDYGLPVMTMMVTRYTLLLDHLRHTATLVYLAEAGDEQAYQAARDKLHGCLARLKGPDNGLGAGRPEPEAGTRDEPVVTFDRAGFCRAVEKCREYIAAGEVFQVVLSQRFSFSLRAHPFDVYRALRSLNPSPYLFYLNLPGVCLAGASPEALVRVDDGRVETHPIAGTRPRGEDPAADRLLAAELVDDDKERAEHVMLVDLGRNDLGRVCRPGTVKVERFMEVEYYSHVMHLVSRVAGELAPSYSALDALAGVFPAGTLSGAPKIRAMEIIEELEPVCRGPYGGAVGYLGFGGSLDTCITIRTVVMRQGRADIQVGAGIVADSEPEREYRETLNKAQALFTALARAEEGFA